MATTVSMPQLGETVTEGTILRWAKQVGDTISADEVLVEISTDKVDTEVPSPASGVVLDILVAEGDTVGVGTALALIGEASEATGAPSSPEPESSPTAEPAPHEPAPDAATSAAPAPVSESPVSEPPAPETPVAEPQPAPQPAASVPAATVTMPQLGETVTEGTILRWAKQVGDTISADEVLVEISTDKVDTEVPSPASGVVLEILVAEGDTVGVGTALAVIGEASGTTAAAGSPAPAAPQEEAATQAPTQAPVQAETQQAAAPAPVAEAPLAPVATTGTEAAPAGRLLSPVVRRLVREHGLDVERIHGTGEGSRITRKDVESFIAAAAAAPEVPAVEAPPAAAPAP
ncbi:MAG: biotin/lipoyl-containing protein, partial [Acidimicrobiia bacterium]